MSSPFDATCIGYIKGLYHCIVEVHILISVENMCEQVESLDGLILKFIVDYFCVGDCAMHYYPELFQEVVSMIYPFGFSTGGRHNILVCAGSPRCLCIMLIDGSLRDFKC